MKSNSIPEALQRIVAIMQKFPGLGPKSALRCVMYLLDMPEQEVQKLGSYICSLRSELFRCTECGVLTEQNPCIVCSDKRRDPKLLCIVAEWDSFLVIEQAGFYNGRYLVLGNLHSPINNAYIDPADMDRLTRKIRNDAVQEIVFALGTTIEAENTATYLLQNIKKINPHILVSRLAQGIPLGAEVKFMDKETLRQSMSYRQTLYK